MQFEWDDIKEQQNIHKHGIDFSTAALVFTDTNRIEYFDDNTSINEDRYITIGLIDDVLTVVYTMRRDVYRIISARFATKAETEAYYGYKKGKY